MENSRAQKSSFRLFSKNFRTAIAMEFFERGSYYGVIGSGIGGILGANLYVYFVNMLYYHNPTLLWIVSGLIGVVTAIGLILYNKFPALKNIGV